MKKRVVFAILTVILCMSMAAPVFASPGQSFYWSGICWYYPNENQSLVSGPKTDTGVANVYTNIGYTNGTQKPYSLYCATTSSAYYKDASQGGSVRRSNASSTYPYIHDIYYTGSGSYYYGHTITLKFKPVSPDLNKVQIMFYP
ncbi:MAG: hypothetical protein FWF88_02695 [Peptococcaceae bacterium]|nr:hypothetical protein [Peptococcaceae bacterium]